MAEQSELQTLGHLGMSPKFWQKIFGMRWCIRALYCVNYIFACRFCHTVFKSPAFASDDTVDDVRKITIAFGEQFIRWRRYCLKHHNLDTEVVFKIHKTQHALMFCNKYHCARVTVMARNRKSKRHTDYTKCTCMDNILKKLCWRHDFPGLGLNKYVLLGPFKIIVKLNLCCHIFGTLQKMFLHFRLFWKITMDWIRHAQIATPIIRPTTHPRTGRSEQMREH